MRIGAEGKLVDEVAFDLVADVEAGVRFFGEDVLPVLRDDAVPPLPPMELALSMECE